MLKNVLRKLLSTFTILVGLFSRPASFLALFTMLIAALKHITTTGSPEKAWLYFSVFLAIFLLGPGKYSLDKIFFSKESS